MHLLAADFGDYSERRGMFSSRVACNVRLAVPYEPRLGMKHPCSLSGSLVLSLQLPYIYQSCRRGWVSWWRWAFSSFSQADAHNDAIPEQWWLHTITEITGFWQISQFRDKGINGLILCLVSRIKDVSFIYLIKFSDYGLLQFLQDEAHWFRLRAVVLREIVDFKCCWS